MEQRGANARLQAELTAAAETAAAEAGAARTRTAAATDADQVRLTGAAEAERVRELGLAEAAGEAARVAAVRDVPGDVLGALALRELAAHLPEIGHLTITPDVLTSLG